MTGTKNDSRRFLILSFCLLGLGPIGVAYAGHGIDAYTIMAGVSGNVLPEQALNGKGHQVRPNPNAMANDHVTFPFPNGTAKVAKRKRMIVDQRGQTWVGKFEGEIGGTVILSHRKGIVSGIIDDGENLYELVRGKSGKTIIFQVDQSKLPPLARPLMGEIGGGGVDPGSEQSAAEGTIQDIMLVYTPAVKESYGGSVATTESALLDAIVATNQSYVDSLINNQLNVVHMVEVPYTETGDMGVTLSRLRLTTDGWFDEVHALRNTYAADLVAMISMDTNYCGIAYIPGSVSTSQQYVGFSVTKKSCLSGATLDHEIGHNQGACHNREETTCYYPVLPYGYGLCGPGFRTIMSYSGSGCSTRIRRFSNPNVNHNGEPTGIDHNTNPATSADVARTINETASTISQYRIGAPTPPLAPSSLDATSISDSEISLTWQDNANVETGFDIQRSLDGGGSWSSLISLDANTTSYSHTGLDPLTLYHFQVRTTNSAGNSSWSGTAGARTMAPPPPPYTSDSFGATAISGNQIDLVWSDVENETGYRVERSDDDGVIYRIVASPDANVTSFSDFGLSPGKTYYYKLYSFNTGGDSLPPISTSTRTLDFEDFTVISEKTTFGRLSGDYQATHDLDGYAESIEETLSRGKKRNRQSRLEHRWQFDLDDSSAATLIAESWKSGSSEDDFIFEYSTDGSNYSHAFVVSTTDPQNHSVPLELSDQELPGTLYIRVRDSNREKSMQSIETLHVDYLAVRVEGGNDILVEKPNAPGSLIANVESANRIALDWVDNSIDETGFKIERSTNYGDFEPLDTTRSAPYIDNSAVGGNQYQFRVNSYNAAGDSPWVQSLVVSTPAGLTLDTTLIQKKQVILQWNSSVSTEYSVFRNNIEIGRTTASANSYLDRIKARGHGSYIYKVCEIVGGLEFNNCSNESTVQF